MKQTILIDVDGVLLDMFPPVREYIKLKFDKDIDPYMITSWDWDYALGIPVMSDEFWDHIWGSELQPFHGAISFVKTLQDLNCNVVAVSCRSYPNAKANAERQFPAFNFDDYILCDKFEEKVDHAYTIDATWSLEDNPKTAAALGRDCDLRSYLLDRPWNRYAIALTGDYKRIRSYQEFIWEYVNSLGENSQKGSK